MSYIAFVVLCLATESVLLVFSQPATTVCEAGKFCKTDGDCQVNQRCRLTSCGQKRCSISPPYPAPPVLTCATVLCITGSTCSEVVECRTCPIKIACIPQSDLIKEDGTCQRKGYSQAILLKQQTTTSTSYSQLLCRGRSSTYTRVCPSGSVCVAAGRGRGVCCRGKINP